MNESPLIPLFTAHAVDAKDWDKNYPIDRKYVLDTVLWRHEITIRQYSHNRRNEAHVEVELSLRPFQLFGWLGLRYRRYNDEVLTHSEIRGKYGISLQGPVRELPAGA